MFHNEGKNVRTQSGIVIWDGITSPDIGDDGTVSHSVKIAIPQNADETAELEQLANATLAASADFKGVLPPGGNWPIMDLDVSKLGDSAPLMAGRIAINAKTRRGVPPVYDANGQQLNTMQIGQMLYPGCVVELLVHCYAFNNKSKGVAYGLDGIMIIDATAPKLDVGGGMAASQVAAAFGTPSQGAAPTMPTQQAPVHTAANGAVVTPPPTVQPNTDFVVNAGQPGAVVTPPPTVVTPPQTPLRVMTAAAQGMTYEAAIGAGWTDETLIANGMMQP